MKILPDDSNLLNCEQALLCSMLVSKRARLEAFAWGIRIQDFEDPRDKEFFAVLRSLQDLAKPFDLVLICETLKQMGMHVLNDAYVHQVSTVIEVGSNWKYYCEILRENAMRRDVLGAADDLAALCKLSTTIEEIKAAAAAIPGLCELKAVVSNLEEQVEMLADDLERMVRPERFATGIPDLDAALDGGVERGEMLVVGGETSSGKSVLLLMAVLEAIQLERSCAVFSLEMTPVSVLKRIACNYTATALKSLADYPTPSEKEQAGKALEFLRGKRDVLSIPRENDIDAIESFCRACHPSLIVVDYLQLVQSSEGDNREQQVSAICRRLKNLAEQCNSAIITASQLNEEGRLRESRAIGQHADHVVLIGSESSSLTISKNRRGPAGAKLSVAFRGAISRFE